MHEFLLINQVNVFSAFYIGVANDRAYFYLTVGKLYLNMQKELSVLTSTRNLATVETKCI